MPETFRTFTDARKREVRVSFDQDGTAFYCSTDVAALLGYKAPRNAVMRALEADPAFRVARRRVETITTNGQFKRKTATYVRCFDEENTLRFLERSTENNEAVRWFREVVIPQVQRVSLELAAGRGREAPPVPQQPSGPEEERRPGAASIVDRLDAVIMECVLMKQELSRR